MTLWCSFRSTTIMRRGLGLGVNNFGTNMLPRIGVKMGTRAPENMKTSRHPHGETFLRRMASSSTKLDPVQVRKKESGTNLTILILF